MDSGDTFGKKFDVFPGKSHLSLFMIVAIMCDKGDVYNPCGQPCEDTCARLRGEEPVCDNQNCEEGCFCPHGMVRGDG